MCFNAFVTSCAAPGASDWSDQLSVGFLTRKDRAPYQGAQNAVAERVIQTFRKECFDRLPPVLGCAHAERLMQPYLELYNHHRPHDTLNFHSPENDVFEPYRKCVRTLTSIPIFHGLWNHYQWSQD